MARPVSVAIPGHVEYLSEHVVAPRPDPVGADEFTRSSLQASAPYSHLARVRFTQVLEPVRVSRGTGAGTALDQR